MSSLFRAAVCLVLAAASAVADEAPVKPVRPGPGWWSLRPVRRPGVPRVRDSAWVRTPVDAFILARLEAEGLEPAAEADRRTILRRVTFDLIGLPPTPEEIDAFLADPSPDAYEKVVDRLLASPHLGERWARHWLDVARFGESQGYERDKLRPNAWPYRDYVIGAFNSDRPYTQFVRDQIAGDVLAPVSAEGIAATGFLTAGPWDEVGHTQQGAVMRQRVREEEMEDLVGTVGQAFLGMTINCARCHDHKLDPIPQRDYYRVKAALEGVRHGERPLLSPAAQRTRAEGIQRLQKEIATLERELADLEREARRKVLAEGGSAGDGGLAAPLARWTFEADARDQVGAMHGTLLGGARIAGGRLVLNGTRAFLRSAPLSHRLRARTLEVWTTLAGVEQRGGGVITIQDGPGKVFDSIVLGERQPGKWIAGSSHFHRTRDLDAPAETADPGRLVHLAIVYGADSSIAVYRDGQPYGKPYVPTGPSASLRTYEAGDGHVLLGLRHTGAGNGFFGGAVEEARLHGRALDAGEVAASFRAGVERVPPEKLVAALTPVERAKRDQVLRLLAGKRQEHAELGRGPELVYAASPRAPEPTFVLHRGDVLRPGERVAAGGLSALGGLPAEWGLAPDAPEGERRVKLAEWIASPRNPLTARVIVNRLWQHHFGQGIVATPSDFGQGGAEPTHPQLLDWLAADLVGHGWSLKHLHRLLVCSSTYRQGARFDARAAARDADCRWLWRYPPRRLEGEAVRDAMLTSSGLLEPVVGGPSYQPFTVRVFNSSFYDLADPTRREFNRRSIYRMSVGSARSPFLDAFDCPEPSVKTPRRSVTTTPLQALALMNGRFVLHQAGQMAARVRRETRGPDEAMRRAYLLALGRPPTAKEAAHAGRLAGEHGLETLCWVLLNTSEMLYVR